MKRHRRCAARSPAVSRCRPTSTCATISSAPRFLLRPATAARAEDAAHGAAHLGGHALGRARTGSPALAGSGAPEGPSAGVVLVVDRGRRIGVFHCGRRQRRRERPLPSRHARDEHRLDGGAVAKGHQELARTVRRVTRVGHADGGPEVERLQLGAQGLGKVAHPVGRQDAPRVEPAKDLAGVEGLRAELLQRLGPLLGESAERGRHARSGSLRRRHARETTAQPPGPQLQRLPLTL